LTGPAQRLIKPRPLQGGTSAPTQRRLASELEAFLKVKYATIAARKHAIFQHFQRNPTLYLCKDNPEWVHPIQQEVITKIEEFWTLEKCLSVQIHCKVGHAEKYQHLINITSKNYNEQKQEWAHQELLEKGSKVFLPKFKSKNQVTGLRTKIASVIPLIQDEAGKAC
jgi:hypothetical protein